MAEKKVSDTAEACPDCGFGIKKFYEDKYRKEQEEIKCKELAEQERLRKIKEEENRLKDEKIRKETESERQQKALQNLNNRRKEVSKMNTIYCVVEIIAIPLLVWS